MKLTKRIAAIAATAVMAMTSMVGMGTFAVNTGDIYTYETMTLEEFAIERTRNANYEGKYIDNANKTSYIDNQYISNTQILTIYDVYAMNGKRVKGTTTNFRLGEDSTATSYGFNANLTKNNYDIYNENTGVWTTGNSGNATLNGHVTVVKKNYQYYYSYISICTDDYEYMQVLVQEH